MDEFSDFQMAVGHKKPAVGRGSSLGGRGTGLWVLDHNHSMSSNLFQKAGPRVGGNTGNMTQTSVLPPLFAHPIVPSSSTSTGPDSASHHSHLEMNSVGSRLANYNLGINSSSTEKPSGSGSSQNISRLNSDTSLLPGMTAHSNSRNQRSLMGEEDRYAALRSLVDTTPEESQKSSSHSEMNSGGWQLGSERSPPREASKSILNDDFTSDFGDFQSFTEVSGQEVPRMSLGASITCGMEPNVFSPHSRQDIPKLLNGSNYELEFGDFVSVQPSFGSSIAPASKMLSTNKKTNRSVMAPPAQNQALGQIDFFCSSLPSHEITTTSAIDDLMVTNGGLTSTHLSDNGSIHGAEPFKRPSFIKTSLIGYDTSIGDMDPSKCASLEESNNESLDCGFTGQKEIFNNFEKHGSLEISPETRSLASLDLGNYYASSDYNDSGKVTVDQLTLQSTDNSFNNKSLITPALISNVSHEHGDSPLSSNLPIDYKTDKYQCFKEEVENEMERCSVEWIRCLNSCNSEISNAISLFNGASSSEVIREVVLDDQGFSYIQNLLELFLVCTRIHKSYRRLGGSIRVGNLCTDVETQWETLSSSFIGTTVMDLVTFPEDWRGEDMPQEGKRFCGVCMIDADRDTNNTVLPSLSSIPLSSDEKETHRRSSGDQLSPYI